MPEVPLNRVVSVTSADPRFPAQNLLQPEAGGSWRSAKAGEKQISVVVEVLLPTAAFMSPNESRAGAEPRRVRFFGPEALVKGVAGRGWDRLRLVCSQPYCQDEEDDAPPAAPVRRLGPFTVREEGGSPRRPPGALFYQRPPSPPPAPPQDPPGPSYALATLQASAGSAPKPPKRRPPPKPNGSPRPKEAKANQPAPAPPPPRPASPPPPRPILAGVVLALSGFQNPLRSQLRAAAVAMGAAYRPDWTPDSTHLVSAFPRTPKAARARALGGLLIGPAWIWDCQRLQRRLPCGPYLLDGSASSGSEGEGSEEAPPTPRPRPAHKTPPPPDPAPSGGPGTPPTSDPPGSDSGDDDDQSEGDDPYGGSTEENSEEGEGEGEEPIPPLPDFFEDKTFFFHGEFPAGEGRLLLRYVTAFGGTLAPYMNDSVTHVVTAQDWDPAFEEALELRPSLTFVRPRWLLLCGERQRPLPAQPFAVVPRP